MARYHVYGVGNALVDLEYEVPESLLGELAVDKSLMTLIEEARHHELLAKLDGVECRPCGGGSAANTMVAVAQLGGSAFYSCKVADDETGHFFVADLAANGLETNLDDGALEQGLTGKCIILITPDAERSMSTFLGITRELSPAALDVAAIRDSAHLYIEGYLVPETDARAAAVRAANVAREAGVPVALTLSDVNMVKFFKDGLTEIVGPGLDLAFANEEEARAWFGTSSIEESVAAMRGIARRFVVTRGPEGAILFDGDDTIEVPAERVTAVDATGAGDVYAGAFLHGLTRGMDFRTCGELAGARGDRAGHARGRSADEGGAHGHRSTLRRGGLTPPVATAAHCMPTERAHLVQMPPSRRTECR